MKARTHARTHSPCVHGPLQSPLTLLFNFFNWSRLSFVRTDFASWEYISRIWGPLECGEDQLNEPRTSWMSLGPGDWVGGMHNEKIVSVCFVKIDHFGTKWASQEFGDQFIGLRTSWMGWGSFKWITMISPYIYNKKRMLRIWYFVILAL